MTLKKRYQCCCVIKIDPFIHFIVWIVANELFYQLQDHRLRRWFPIDEAKYILAKPLHAKYLNALEESSSSIIYIPDNNVSQTQSDSFPDTTPTNSNSRLHHHNGNKLILR